MNNLSLNQVDKNKFPLTNLLNNLPETNSLYETVLITANDEFVKLFLNKKIKFSKIFEETIKMIKRTEFNKLKKIQPNKISDVIDTRNLVRNKIKSYYLN